MADLQSPACNRRVWGALAIFRGPLLAAGLPPILIATLGVLLGQLGTRGIDWALSTRSTVPVRTMANQVEAFGFTRPADGFVTVTEPVRVVFVPISKLFSPEPNWSLRIHAACYAGWMVLVWGVFGTAIARTIMQRATTGSYLGVIPSLRFALSKLSTLVGTPIAPLVIAGMLGLPGLIVGLLARIPGIGSTLGVALGFIPLLFGVIATVILFGLALGWPLIFASIAAEAEDGFDALSRSYSYVRHRFLLYLPILGLCILASTIGLFAARLFAAGAIEFAAWSTFGKPEILEAWQVAVDFLIVGWIYANFWSIFALLYLWLRHDVDGTEFNRLAVIEVAASAEPPVFSEPTASENTTETPTA